MNSMGGMDLTDNRIHSLSRKDIRNHNSYHNLNLKKILLDWKL